MAEALLVVALALVVQVVFLLQAVELAEAALLEEFESYIMFYLGWL
jgi:uncharacterized protein YoxC